MCIFNQGRSIRQARCRKLRSHTCCSRNSLRCSWHRATGFIGSAIVLELINVGHEVLRSRAALVQRSPFRCRRLSGTRQPFTCLVGHVRGAGPSGPQARKPGTSGRGTRPGARLIADLEQMRRFEA